LQETRLRVQFLLASSILNSQVNPVTEVRYNVRMEKPAGYVADAIAGDMIFEVKRYASESKRLNGTLFELAQVASARNQSRVILVLTEPVLSIERISSTWSSVTEVLRSDLAARMAIWIRREEPSEERYIGFPSGPCEAEVQLIDEILESPSITEWHRGPSQGNSLSEVLRLLLCRWLTNKGPITLTEIGETLGYTFKPVRASLDELSRYLIQHGNRGVELATFPRDAWARLVHNSAAVRGTLHFTNRADNGRTPESLLRRFQKLGLPHIAVSGVEGARQYFPQIDLIGLPRLDLCIHARTAKPDLGFIRSLDPGLEQASNRDASGPLVLHFLHRKSSLFENGWADPVECLLDLHEMRLESQASQFLRSFPAANKESL
jgi:hypothetical protein